MRNFFLRSYVARSEASALDASAAGPRKITGSQAAKIRAQIGTNVNDQLIFVESIADQEADNFAASLTAFPKSLGAKVIEQHFFREPKPVGLLFRYSIENQAGSLLMDTLKNDVSRASRREIK